MDFQGMADRMNRSIALGSPLNLAGSGGGPQMAFMLAAKMKANVSPPEADISSNDIGDIGASAIAGAIPINRTTHSLNMAANTISDHAAMGIFTAMMHSMTLYKINLDGNKIGNNGATALAALLKTNTTVKEVSLNNQCYYHARSNGVSSRS